MADNLIDFLGTIFTKFEYRELVYTLLVFECAISCILFCIGNILVTGSGFCLGVKYGKTNHLISVIKYICLIAGTLLFCNALLFWILDFLTHMSFSYLFGGLGGIIVFLIFVGLGFGIGASKDEKIAKKYSKQIEDILFANPIFKNTIKIINSNPSIKRIHIYRDGIAFYENQGEIPVVVEEKYTEGAWDYDSASKLLEKHLQNWMADNGTVLKCGTTNHFLYSDYGFENSETAMNEFPVYIHKFVATDFSKHYPYKKKWLYWSRIHIPSSMYAAGGKVYSTGASEKTLSASKKALAYVVVMGEKHNNNAKINNQTQHQPKKW